MGKHFPRQPNPLFGVACISSVDFLGTLVFLYAGSPDCSTIQKILARLRREERWRKEDTGSASEELVKSKQLPPPVSLTSNPQFPVAYHRRNSSHGLHYAEYSIESSYAAGTFEGGRNFWGYQGPKLMRGTSASVCATFLIGTMMNPPYGRLAERFL